MLPATFFSIVIDGIGVLVEIKFDAHGTISA